MTNRTVLVVDDESATRDYLSSFLVSHGYTVDCLDSGEGVLGRVRGSDPPGLILLDVLMPGLSGLDVLREMGHAGLPVPTIVLSGLAQVPTVVQAIKLGAVDYLIKPFDDQELELAIEQALDFSDLPQAAPKPAEARSLPDPDFISTGHKLQRIKELAARIANADVPVLILGESGVGKEVLARFIHARSQRKNRPFVKINCAAVPTELLESELFGHERGAFTGAWREKPGKFELADKGTLLLDEIGDMSPALQAKLLHVLQDGEFARLGGTRPIRADVRVLASTNKRLEQAVAQGQFREDLYYRLNVIRFELPPLRERSEDIPALFRYFLEKHRRKGHCGPAALTPQMMEQLCRHTWPGNIRELENAARRFLLLPELELVSPDSKTLPEPQSDAAPEANRSLKQVAALAAEQAEKELILHALAEANWNRKQAARQLNICYKSLLNKLHRWQITGRSLRPSRNSAAS